MKQEAHINPQPITALDARPASETGDSATESTVGENDTRAIMIRDTMARTDNLRELLLNPPVLVSSIFVSETAYMEVLHGSGLVDVRQQAQVGPMPMTARQKELEAKRQHSAALAGSRQAENWERHILKMIDALAKGREPRKFKSTAKPGNEHFAVTQELVTKFYWRHRTRSMAMKFREDMQQLSDTCGSYSKAVDELRYYAEHGHLKSSSVKRKRSDEDDNAHPEDSDDDQSHSMSLGDDSEESGDDGVEASRESSETSQLDEVEGPEIKEESVRPLSPT